MTHPRKHHETEPQFPAIPFGACRLRMKQYATALFLGTVLTAPASSQQILPLPGDNLLTGKEAAFSVAPDCSHCNGGSRTSLTDGKLWQSNSGTDFWNHQGSVGWDLGSVPGVLIRFDLGTVQPIETLSLHTASGKPDVRIPAAVLAYVSDDGETWRYVTDLINEVVPEGEFGRRRFVSGDYWTGGLRAGGRYLALYMASGGGRTFIDEIEALRGNRDPADAIYDAGAIGKDRLEADALDRAGGVTPQTGSFRHMSTWIRKSYSDAILQTKPAAERRMDNLERYVAIDNKGNWPNLTPMPDGSIVATVFSEPAHGLWEGSAECWISRDGGKTWSFLSVAAPHAPGTNHMIYAAGRTHGGALVVLAGGWGNVPSRGGEPPVPNKKRFLLTPIICRSEDGGRTWTRTPMKVPPNMEDPIPYGGIVMLPRGRLAVSIYSQGPGDLARNTAWIFFSDDDGRTWGKPRLIAADSFNETALLPLDGAKMLAASRTIRWGGMKDEHLELFSSDDGGQTWNGLGPVSLPKEIPADLLRLRDGSILLSYGSRLRGALGVHARISRDGGLTWDAPRVLFTTAAHVSSSGAGGVDGGYPSSVQLDDGSILTAYYCSRLPTHQRYHMGVVFWRY
ncbi:MAG: sialidase family protein [Acidobacteriota bacterium]|nr:sialidase family protein [Acidobacteriota bacterium]